MLKIVTISLQIFSLAITNPLKQTQTAEQIETTEELPSEQNAAPSTTESIPATPLESQSDFEDCPRNTHWLWSNLSNKEGHCVENTVSSCSEYEAFNGSCVRCNDEYYLIKDTTSGEMVCNSEDTSKIIIAVLIVLILIVTLVAVKKFRQANSAPANYYEACKVYATPLRMATPNEQNLQQQKEPETKL